MKSILVYKLALYKHVLFFKNIFARRDRTPELALLKPKYLI
jgi:hypothetical protein